GLVVGATMPRGKVRQLPILSRARNWFSFDKAASLAAAAFVVGMLSDAFVLGYWLYHDRGELTLWFTRLTLFGLVMMSVGVQVGVSALLLGTTTSAELAPEMREMLAGSRDASIKVTRAPAFQ